MIKNLLTVRAVLALMICLLSVLETNAQRAQTGNRQGANRAGAQRTTGGGGGGGGAGSLREYTAPGEIGEAIVTSDPETRRLIVITDEETAPFVSQVITNLDRPKPQVLIKVVFLEVTYSRSEEHTS